MLGTHLIVNVDLPLKANSKSQSDHIHVNIVEARNVVDKMKEKACSSSDNPRQSISISQNIPAVVST